MTWSPWPLRRQTRKADIRLSVLFVCMGNICRSPMAMSIASQQEVDGIVFDSAGTHASDRGEPIDPRAAAALRRRGVEPTRKCRSRRVTAPDLDQFDLILAMDEGIREALLDLCAAEQRAKVRLLLDFAPEYEGQGIPDPYFGGAEGFERVFDLCEAGIAGLLSELGARVPGSQASP